ncbi:MAG: hypothetical protein ACRD68_12560, partial [Pyrinomonadaceae bacterium]
DDTSSMRIKILCPLLILSFAVSGMSAAQAVFLSHVKDKAAVARAAEMLAALGGRERWAALTSLYIRATHTEKSIPKPYRSEIWRNLDAAQIKIVQQNEDFHQTRIVNGPRGWSVDRGGAVRELTAEQLGALLHWDAHLFYKTVRKVALGRPGLDLKLDEKGRLLVYEDGRRLATLELDARNRPYQYSVPRADGQGDGLTIYSEWGESAGYVHPVVSEPQGLDAIYRAEEWRPSRESSTVEFTPGKKGM